LGQPTNYVIWWGEGSAGLLIKEDAQFFGTKICRPHSHSVFTIRRQSSSVAFFADHSSSSRNSI